MADSWKRQLSWTALTTAVFVALCHLTGAGGECIVSSVTTISGNGNIADTDSYITFSPLPTKSYKSTGVYDDGGLGVFFNLARSFINSSLPNTLPIVIIFGFLDGSFDLMTEYSQIIDLCVGYLVCIVIGIVFMVVFPIIGICFCCCRCCGNCGGDRVQNPANNNARKRMTYAGIFGFHVLLTGVGVICLFVSNGRMTAAINGFETLYGDSLTDAVSYMQLLRDQIKHLGTNNYNFVEDVIMRDLNAIDTVFGTRVSALLRIASNFTVNRLSAIALEHTIESLSVTLNSIDSGVTDVDNNVTALKNSLSTVKGNIQNTFTSCSCGGNIDLDSLDTSYDTAAMPSVTSQISALDNAQQVPITTSVDSALTQLSNLPCELKNNSQSAVDDVKTALNNFKNGKLGELISQMTSLTSTFNVSDYSSAADVYISYAKQYDAFRAYAGMGLSGILLLITVLMLLGLILGICSSSIDDPPTERSSLSNSGGNMLIASVILIFVFSWLFMLLATLTYALGAPLERWVCQPVSDFNSPLYTQLYSVLKNMALTLWEEETKQILADVQNHPQVAGRPFHFLDKPGGPLGEGYFIGQALYGNSTMDMTVSGILSVVDEKKRENRLRTSTNTDEDCREGKAAYDAIRLNNFFDIDEVLDYGGYIDFTGKLSSLQSHLAVSVNIMTPELETGLQNVKDAVNVDTDLFISELDRNLTDVDLTAFAQSLRALGDELVANAAPSAAATRTELYNHATAVDAITTNELQDLQTSVNSLKTAVTTLHNQKNQVVVDVDNLEAGLRSTEDYLNNGAAPLLRRETENYIYRLTRILGSYITYTSNSVKTELGKCDILYKLFADIFTIGICRYTLDAFNAIWLALGWCIIFLASGIVFAVKLSKHFQRMDYRDIGDYESKQKSSAERCPSGESGRSMAVHMSTRTPSSSSYVDKHNSDLRRTSNTNAVEDI